eukprot:2522163-Alexandrium_andersonii.AAC.1
MEIAARVKAHKGTVATIRKNVLTSSELQVGLRISLADSLAVSGSLTMSTCSARLTMLQRCRCTASISELQG